MPTLTADLDLAPTEAMKHYEAHPFKRDLTSPVGIHELEGVLTPRRAERFRQVLARRVVDLTVIVDECYDPHNATAVIRTCEAFGIHAVHVVTGRNSFRINRKISQGAHRYVDLHRHDTIESAYRVLRDHGFRIYASNLSAESVVDPHDLPDATGDRPIALVFGNEERGVSREGIEGADGSFLIPMCGFTQSLNLSVTVAITLFSIRHRQLAEDLSGSMTDEEQRNWFDRWIRRQAGRRATGQPRKERSDASGS